MLTQVNNNQTSSEPGTPRLTDGFNLVVDALQLNGVETIYGVVGIPITDLARTAQAKGIRYIGFRHEQAAGHAAAAAGFLTQRPGICLTVSAPGFLNGLVALANATTNCFPMIQISGSSDRADRRPAAGRLRGARPDGHGQAAGQGGLPGRAAPGHRDRGRPGYPRRGLRTPRRGVPGPAGQRARRDDGCAGRASSRCSRWSTPPLASCPPPRRSTRALDLLAQARASADRDRQGRRVRAGRRRIREFVETTGIPFVPMSMAKGLLPDDHPQSAAAARSLALGGADVVMLVGARLNWLLGHGQPPAVVGGLPLRPGGHLGTGDGQQPADRRAGGRRHQLGDGPSSSPLCGPGRSLRARRGWRSSRPGRPTTSSGWPARLAADAVPMNFSGALRAIRDVLAEHPGTYVVNEGANTLDFGRDVLSMSEPRHRLDSGTWGVMGVGMGYAIAAAVETGKPVVAVEGDSAFGFSGMELETICRYRLPVVTVVFNNGGVYKGDEVNQPSSDPAPTVLLQSSRYEQLIEAFGGKGYYAEDPHAVASRPATRPSGGRPAGLVNCLIDPTAGTESGHLQNLNPTARSSHAK